jgi:hypothetical protein
LSEREHAMSNIDARLVMELRRRTDLPVIQCKAVLIKAAGDIEAALRILRRELGCICRSHPLGELNPGSPREADTNKHL